MDLICSFNEVLIILVLPFLVPNCHFSCFQKASFCLFAPYPQNSFGLLEALNLAVKVLTGEIPENSFLLWCGDSVNGRKKSIMHAICQFLFLKSLPDKKIE